MNVGLESTTVAVPAVAAQMSPRSTTPKEYLNPMHNIKPDIIISTPPNVASPRPSLALSGQWPSILHATDFCYSAN